MPRTGRGRFYEAVGGIGLEVERDYNDPEFRWGIACIIEKEGKRRPIYKIKVNQQEESYFAAGCYNTLDEAKTAALEMFKVTEVVEMIACEVCSMAKSRWAVVRHEPPACKIEKPAPFAWMRRG